MNCVFKDVYLIYTMYFFSSVAMVLPLTALYVYLAVDKFQPSDITSYYATVFIPTYLKLLYGFISDIFPICGSRRKAYVFIYYIMMAASYVLYGYIVKSFYSAIVVGFVLETGMAGYELMIDTLVVERVQGDKNDKGKLQSNCMISRCIGTLIGSIGSILLLYFEITPQVMFLITAIISGGLPLAAVFVKEAKPVEVKRKYVDGFKQAYNILFKGNNQGFLGNKAIWPILLFLFVLKVTPNASLVINQYLMVAEQVKDWEVNIINFISSIASVLGIYMYKVFLTKLPLWKLFIITGVLNAATAMTQIAFVTDFYKITHIPLAWFAGIDEALCTAAGQIAYMPIIIISAKLCPKGIEGMIWAILLSTCDLASSISGYISSALLKLLGITTADYNQFWLLLVITNIINLYPLFMIPFIRHYLDAADNSNVEEIKDLENNENNKGSINENLLSERKEDEVVQIMESDVTPLDRKSNPSLPKIPIQISQ